MQAFFKFLSYNNAVPLVITVLLSGAGATFAATNPESVYSADSSVISVDNTYIAAVNLESYTPRVEIIGVTEDDENFYVKYRFTTIDVEDNVWKDVVKEGMLVGPKALIDAQDSNLGYYATEQLNQLIDHEIARLRETQEIAKKQVTQKIVATAYSGLVGRFLDETTEVIPGYEPIIAAPRQDPPPEPEPLPPHEGSSNESQPTPEGGSASTNDTTVPVLQALGENPVRIALGAEYKDLGVLVSDLPNLNLEVQAFVNGSTSAVSPSQIAIDTSKDGEWTIVYKATDSGGNTGTATRTVIVGKGNAPEPEAPASSASSTPPVATSTPSAATSTPAKAPDPVPAPAATSTSTTTSE